MKSESMHYGSGSYLFSMAKSLRNNQTYPENILWEALRNKKLRGVKFRREHPIGRFIVDFYSHKYKLVIEVDGSVHDQEEVRQRDLEREEELK